MASTAWPAHPGNCCCATVMRCVWPPLRAGPAELVSQTDLTGRPAATRGERPALAAAARPRRVGLLGSPAAGAGARTCALRAPAALYDRQNQPAQFPESSEHREKTKNH